MSTETGRTEPGTGPTSTRTGPLAGVRILEVATHVFVPMSGAVAADWGADVIKIEVPAGGDPYRALVTAGMHKTHNGYDTHFQAVNRGKRSVAIDLKQEEGMGLLHRILASSDVFVTNLRADALRRLKLEVADVRAVNPDLVYVRGTAYGPEGPDGERGGYDSSGYWARSGMQQIFTRPGDEWPANPRPAFGDAVGGMTLAGAIGTALFQRAATGVPPTVDVSLLALGMWQVQMDVMNASLAPAGTPRFVPSRYEMPNPLMLAYRTSDGRFINLQQLAPDKYWPDLCQILGEPEKASDPRFVDIDARAANSRACIEWLEGIFASRSFEEWKKTLADFPGEWVPSLKPDEVPDDPQVVANGYMATIPLDDLDLRVVAPPVQFDRRRVSPSRAPELGEDTESVLIDLGLSWEDLGDLKAKKVII